MLALTMGLKFYSLNVLYYTEKNCVFLQSIWMFVYTVIGVLKCNRVEIGGVDLE